MRDENLDGKKGKCIYYDSCHNFKKDSEGNCFGNNYYKCTSAQFAGISLERLSRMSKEVTTHDR